MPPDGSLPVLDLDPVPSPATGASAATAPSTLPVLDLDPVPAPVTPAPVVPGPEPQFIDPMSGMPMSAPVVPPPAAAPPALGEIFGPPMPPTDRDLEGQRATAMATMPGPVPPPAPGALSNWLGLPGPAAPPGPPVPPAPDTGEGFISGLGSGYQGMLRNYARTFSGQAFTPDPTAPPEPKERTWLNTLGYGLGASPVVLGGGIAGGVAGGAAGTAVAPGPGTIAGTILGSGLGMGIPALVETLGPSYQAAMQRPGMTHDQAVDYAINRSIATGGITAATAPLFVLSPVKGLVGRILYQSFVGMPAAGTATRIGVPAVMGDPLPTLAELGQGASHDVVMGLGFGLGHAAGNRIINGPAPVPPVPATSPIDAAVVRALQPTGQLTPTERPATAAPPAAGEPYAQTVVPAEPARAAPAPVEAPVPPAPGPAEPPVAAIEPGQTRSAIGRQAPPEPAPAEQPAVPVAEAPRTEPSRPLVIGEPVDRPGGAPGRPGEPTPMGEAGPAPVVPGTGEVPGRPGVGTGPGERPPDLEGTRRAEQPAAQPALPAGEARSEVGAEPPVRQAPEAPAAETTPVTGLRIGASEGDVYPGSNAQKYPLMRGEERVGDAHVVFMNEGKTAYIDTVETPGGYGQTEAGGRVGANRFGPRELREIARQFFEAHPEVEQIQGRRVTGAREGTGRADELITITREQVQRGATRLTTEPDDVVPGQHVAKNPAGEVVGKGASPEAAITDAQRRSGTPYAEELPAARAPEDYRTLRPDISAAEYSRRLAELRDNKPRSINKLWNNPETAPPDRVEAARQALRDWNRENRQVQKAFGAALERDNAAYRARQTPPGPPPGERMPGLEALDRNRAILDEQRTAAEQRLAELSPAERAGIRLNEEQQETGRIEAVVPGPREDAGTTGPREAVSETGPELSTERSTDPTLTKLQATRDALTNKVRTPAEERKLNTINQQIARREAALEKARATEPVQDTVTEERGAGRKAPFTGPPEVGRERTLTDYKFNDGTSVFREVFREAGHDPDLAVSWPAKRQAEVLAEHMKNKFGFSDVTVSGGTLTRNKGRAASPVDHFTATQAMLDMTRALTDGMSSMGLPHDAASLGGRLRLVIEPEGMANYYGAYAHDGAIHIMAGANSYGHEWTHAIDHLLAERFTGNPAQMNKLLTQYGRDTGLDTRDNVQAAFAKLINTLFYDDVALATRRLALEVQAAKVDKAGNPTKGALDAQKQLTLMEGGGSKLRILSSEFRRESAAFHPPKADYYSSVYEMLARSHEAYLANVSERAGLDPRGWVMPDEAYLSMLDRQLRMAYPKGTERAEIFAAWDEVHHAMRREQVLDAGKPPGDKADYGISDNYRWRSTAPNANRTTIGQKVSAEINSIRNFSQTIRERAGLFDPNRPKAPQPLSQRFVDQARIFYKATRGMMKIIIARAPDEAKAILQPIADSVATDPGSGRRTNENFHEIVERRRKTWNFQYGNIKENHGFGEYNPMTAEEGRMLRHLLVTGDRNMPNDPSLQSAGTTRIPDKIVALHGDVRQLMNELWQTSRDAKLDIGYAKNGFFPRHYDRYRAAADAAGFNKAADQLYRLMFDQELGTPGDKPQALLEKWTAGLDKESRLLAAAKAGTAIDLPATMRELQKNLLRQGELENSATPLTPVERAELAQLKIDAKQLAADAHPHLRDYIAEANAASWHANLTGGALHDFDTGAPTGSYLQARVLPPEADLIMRNFMEQDPEVALPAYFNAVARRTAFAEQFGPKGEVLTKAKQDLARVPGMDGFDTDKFFTLVDDVTGRHSRGGMNKFLQIPHNMVQAAGAMVLMERAMWASLHEPMAAAMVTGDVRAGLSTLGKSIGQLYETMIGGNQAARDRTTLAEFLSVITSPQYDSTMLSRMGAAYDDSPRMGRFLSQFYRTTGLTQVTNGQRAASVGTSNWFINKLSQDLLSTNNHARDNAGRWFNELGLPESIHKGFAQWMVDLGGQLPTPEMLSVKPGGNAATAGQSGTMTGMGEAYSLAVRRLVDRIIQDPKPVDRSLLANVPGLGLAFQLMSFNYSFHENVLIPAAKRILYQFTRGRGEAESAGSSRAMANVKATFGTAGTMVNTLGIATAMVGAALMTGVVRQLLFAPEQLKKHDEEGDLPLYLLRLALSRSGLYGKWDPVQQTVNHLKYDSDISSMVHGAAINWFAKNTQDLIMPLLGGAGTNAPGTNTAEFNQARAAFNLGGVPVAALGLTMLGTMGPISRVLSGIALQAGTSPMASNLAGYLWAGHKGATMPTSGGGGGGGLPTLPKLSTGLPKLPKLGQGSGGGLPPPEKPSGFEGLIGDIAIPAIGYVAGQLPGASLPVKIGAGVAAGAAGAYELYKENQAVAPFRSLPKPPPKKPTVGR